MTTFSGGMAVGLEARNHVNSLYPHSLKRLQLFSPSNAYKGSYRMPFIGLYAQKHNLRSMTSSKR